MSPHDSIRRKLISVMLITSCTVVVTASVAFVCYELITFRDSARERLGTLAQVIAANSSSPLAFADAKDAQEVISALAADPQVRRAALYDRDGKLFITYPTGTNATAFPSHPPSERFRFHGWQLEVSEPIREGERELGKLYIVSNLAAVKRRLGLYVLISIGVTIGAVILAWFLARAMQRRISDPILHLTDTAREISADRDYSVRAKKESSDEIGVLTDTFNQMLAEIERGKAELEERVQARTADLAQANEDLESFASSVAHDLRAPLRHIEAYAEIISEESGTQLSKELRAYLVRILESSKSMGTVIDDLLALSRASRTELNIQPVNFNAMIEEVLSDFREELAGREVQWRIGDLGTVRCDPGLLTRAVTNLVSNALKYTRFRDVTIIQIDKTSMKGETVFFIRDNGVGFDMKFADRLFKAFQRLDASGRFEGVGIGLLTVSRIIRRHGGRIWAEAVPDQGATFYFTLSERKEIA